MRSTWGIHRGPVGLEPPGRARFGPRADGAGSRRWVVIGGLEALVAELEPLVQDMSHWDSYAKIRDAALLHGPGPYTTEDLAAIAGVSNDGAARILAQLVEAGVAEPPPA